MESGPYLDGCQGHGEVKGKKERNERRQQQASIIMAHSCTRQGRLGEWSMQEA